MTAVLLLSLLTGCKDTEGILLHFDGPIAAAIVPGGSSIQKRADQPRIGVTVSSYGAQGTFRPHLHELERA